MHNIIIQLYCQKVHSSLPWYTKHRIPSKYVFTPTTGNIYNEDEVLEKNKKKKQTEKQLNKSIYIYTSK